MMEVTERHRPAAGKGGDQALAVLELAGELERRHAQILDLLDRHLGVKRGNGIPAAVVPDPDLDGGLPDAEADESLTVLQDVVAGIGGGGPAEGVADDGWIDPGDQGMSGLTGHREFL